MFISFQKNTKIKFIACTVWELGLEMLTLPSNLPQNGIISTAQNFVLVADRAFFSFGG